MHKEAQRSKGSYGFLAALLAFAVACATTMPAPLTLDEKIGQLFVIASTGRFMNERSFEYRELVRHVRDNHVGGVLWYLYSDVYETALLNRKLQENARVPLLVSADLEAGLGMRFHDTTYWPWPMAVAATGDPDLARRQGSFIAAEARAIGLNEIMAPVADVNIDPDNPVINVRSFGEDPRDVSRYVAAFVRGVQSEGILATAKHFPGHGDTHTDSHRSLSVLLANRERLQSVELLPFRAAIEAGVGAVMTAHLSVPELDATPAPPREGAERDNPYTKDLAEVTRGATVPASLSAAVTEGLLRRELGFGGLVVTDALDMGGITDHFEAGEAAVLSILAGADQVLKSPNVEAAIAGVKRAVQSGRISNARLDASVARILAAKKRFPPRPAGVDEIFRSVESPEHRALSQEIARRSLTLVREAAGVLPLSRAERIVHVVVTDQPRFAEEVTDALRSRLDAPPSAFLLDPLSTPADVETTVSGAAAADKVIVSIVARFQSGRGSIAIPAAGRAAIARILAGTPPVVVAVLGSPYLLRDFPVAATALLAWGSQSDHQAALVRALFGEAAVGGHLPVTIPGIAARGAGIARAARTSGGPG
ncbi:MAG: glycoside hydrolase family 3 protein [Acidobacteriota bacterium]|nr:glycoside hydrolase family 3 protein [Acidobacteriota bacterium]